MKRSIAVLGTLVALGVGCIGGGAWPVARAATPHDAPASFLISTLEATAYAPDGAGTITSPGYRDGRVVYVVHLRRLPPPATLGGAVYKVWLINPAGVVVMPGGVLDYHADGSADGTFVSLYHDYTVLAVTPEKSAFGSTPENDKVLDGTVNPAALQEALATHVAQLTVTENHVPAAYTKTATTAATATGQATMPRAARALTVRDAAATSTSTILLTPLSDPHGTLWIGARGAGTFTIKASGRLPAAVTVQYLIINR